MRLQRGILAHRAKGWSEASASKVKETGSRIDEDLARRGGKIIEVWFYISCGDSKMGEFKWWSLLRRMEGEEFVWISNL